MNTATNEVFIGLQHENAINWSGGKEPLRGLGGVKIWYVGGESTRGIFPGDEMSKFLASREGAPSLSPSAGKNLFVLDTLARRHKGTSA